MRLTNQDFQCSRHKVPIWSSSLFFSASVIVAYPHLEELLFIPIIASLAFGHIAIVIVQDPQLSARLILSQFLIAGSSVVSVVLHTRDAVGEVPPDLEAVLGTFVKASITDPSTYFWFGRNLLLFSFVLGTAVLMRGHLSEHESLDFDSVLVIAYAMSSVNIVFEYSLTRPLYQVSAEPKAAAFFFTSGLFGMELSLPLYLLILGICLLRHSWSDRQASSD